MSITREKKLAFEEINQKIDQIKKHIRTLQKNLSSLDSWCDHDQILATEEIMQNHQKTLENYEKKRMELIPTDYQNQFHQLNIQIEKLQIREAKLNLQRSSKDDDQDELVKVQMTLKYFLKQRNDFLIKQKKNTPYSMSFNLFSNTNSDIELYGTPLPGTSIEMSKS
jgi:hypothetical protein